MSSLKNTLEKLNGRLQRGVLLVLVALILVLPTGLVAAAEGVPCSSGCKSISAPR